MSVIRETQEHDVPVVDVGSDDEGATGSAAGPLGNDDCSEPKVQLWQQKTAASNSAMSTSIGSRSFWKAGDYVVAPSSKPAPVQGYLEHARVHPKFLHSNATSHKWAFGAIAELVDNAVDEIQNGATFVKIDKLDIVKDNSPALSFIDDGGGMDPESIRKCMSLGYSSKKSKTTIGQYGNGFKTSTMRLGADVIVFSRATCSSRATQSVGLLSYTFLRRTGQDDVIVPMIDFDISGHWPEPIIYSSQDDWSDNLKTILDWSPFTSKEELMLQFDDIGSHGTKVIIYNLWLNDEGVYELSFDDNAEDIMLRDEANHGGEVKKLNKKTVELRSHISYRLRFSLRAYVSILYFRKFSNFKIILRGKPVEQFNIADELKHSEVIRYKPQVAMASNEVTVATTIGFIKEAPHLNVAGFNVYHKNRLIKPFWKVTPDGSSKGNGVVGVLEANFIEPAHDKQDFERSLLFTRMEAKLKQMVSDYWKGHCHLVGYQPPNFRSQSVLKETHVRQSAGHPTYSQNDFLVDQQEVNIVAQNQKDLSSDHPIVGFPANDLRQLSHGQHGTSVGTQESISADKICEENIQLFMRCEEHRKKEMVLKKTVEDLEEELKEVQRKCAHLSSLLEAKKKQSVKE